MPNSTLCVCKELTKLHEKITYGQVSDVLQDMKNDENAERGEYVVIGYNNDYEEQDEAGYNVSLQALIFDKLYNKK